jgi:hypothetical protein
VNHIFIRRQVSNYDQWKTGYDADAPARENAGLKQERLLRSVDHPNEVVILFSASDLEKAKAFASSKELREKMKKVGVIDEPDAYFLTD